MGGEDCVDEGAFAEAGLTCDLNFVSALVVVGYGLDVEKCADSCELRAQWC